MVQNVSDFSFCHWAKNGWIEVMFYEVLSLMDMPDACLVFFVMSFICQLCIWHHTLSVSPTKHFYHKATTIFFPPFSVRPTNSVVLEKKLFCLVHFLALTSLLMLKCLERF